MAIQLPATVVRLDEPTQQRSWRAHFHGTCDQCGERIQPGDEIYFPRGKAAHLDCDVQETPEHYDES